MKQKIFSIIFVPAISVILFSCSKGGGTSAPAPTPAPVPAISAQDVSQPRTATASTMRFYLNADKTTSSAMSVDYTIVDGTAISPGDYTAAAGTITIPANQTQATIDVQIKGDPTNLRQANLQFTLQLSNPKFCTLTTTSAKGTIITEDGTYLPTDNTGYTTSLTYPGYTLAWSDEFSGTNLDGSVWNQEVGNGVGGWGNNELEYYTNSLKNTFLSNGHLIIEARKEPMVGFNYSSGRMTTQNKKAFKFGRIDIRAKLPVAKGMWPALWMLGSNVTGAGWPACGEMDIMELVGTYPGTVRATMHWKNAGGNHDSRGADFNLSSGNFSQQFHVFSMVWAQDLIKCYVDDQLYLTVAVADVGAGNYPFNADQFFIFNVAVGGNWPGAPDGTTNFPQRMFVDYVRVFQ